MIGILIIVTGLSMIAGFVVLIGSKFVPINNLSVHDKNLKRRGSLLARKKWAGTET